MTLVEALARLAAAVATLQQQIVNLGASGMTPEQQAQFAQALADIASIRATIEGLTQQVSVTQAGIVSLQQQIDAAVAQAQSAASAHAALRDEVAVVRSTVGSINESVGTQGSAIAALRNDVDVLRAGVGDIGSLPPLPQV